MQQQQRQLCCWRWLIPLLLLSSAQSHAGSLVPLPRCSPASFAADYALVPSSAALQERDAPGRATASIALVRPDSCTQTLDGNWTSCAARGRLVIAGHGLCRPQAGWYPSPSCRYWLGGRALLADCNVSVTPPNLRYDWIDCQYDALTLSALQLPSLRPQRLSMTAYTDRHSQGCGDDVLLDRPVTAITRSTQSLTFDGLLPAVEIVNSTGCAGSEVEADETGWSGDGRDHHIAIGCTADSLLTIHTDADIAVTASTRIVLSANSDQRGTQQLVISSRAFVRSTARSVSFHLPFVDNALPVYGSWARRAAVQLDLNDGQHLISRRYAAVQFAAMRPPRITRLSSPHGCALLNATLLTDCQDAATIVVHGQHLTPRLHFQLADDPGRLSLLSTDRDGLRCVYLNSTAFDCRLGVTDAIVAAAATRTHWGIDVLDQHAALTHDTPHLATGLLLAVSERLPLLERVTGCIDRDGYGTFSCVGGRDVLTLHGRHFTAIPDLRMRLWLMPHDGSRFAYQMEAGLSNSSTFLFPLPPPQVFRFEPAVQYQLLYSAQQSFAAALPPAPLEHDRSRQQRSAEAAAAAGRGHDRERVSPLHVSFQRGCRPALLAVSSPSCQSAHSRAVNCSWRHGDLRLVLSGRCLPSLPVEISLGAGRDTVTCQLDDGEEVRRLRLSAGEAETAAQAGWTAAAAAMGSITCRLTCDSARQLRVRQELLLRIVPIRLAPPRYDDWHKWGLEPAALVNHVLSMDGAVSFLPNE